MYKKLFCIALFLIIFTSMACISASENLSTDNNAMANVDEIDVISSQIDDVNNDLSTNDDNEILANQSSENTARLNPNLDATIETDDEYITITSTVNEKATGNISIQITKLNDGSYQFNGTTVEIENGTSTWAEMIAFDKGDYIVSLGYLGDANYNPTSILKVFAIQKYIPDFKVGITQNDEFVTIASILNEDATGNVTIRIKTFEEENYTEFATIELENGAATWADQIPFNKGDYVAYTTYSGDKKYFKSGNIQTFTIEKEIPSFNVNITTDDYFVVLNATLPVNATGNVAIRIRSIDEENYTEFATIEVENGTAIWSDFVPFNKGEYIAYTTYSGDEDYFKSSNIQNFTIEKEITDFNVNVTVNDYLITINATLPVNATGNVTIRIKTFEDENYTEFATIEVENGTATWTSPNPFIKGDYVAYTTYNGDENYFKSSNIQTFTIKKDIPDFDINITVNDYLIVLNATLPVNATGNVAIRIKSVDEENYTEFATIEVENGTAIWSDFAPFNKGDYLVLAVYSGDENYFKSENTGSFTIEKQVPSMIINSTCNATSITIKITLPENATGVVRLTNNQTGEIKNVTLNGTSIEFNETLQYTYNIFLIEYSGDDYYFKISNIFVEPLKIETSLNIKNSVSVIYMNTAKITVRLNMVEESGNFTADGEKVIITVNNKDYAGTLKNDTVTISIAANSANKFIPKSYAASVIFNGNDLFENASASFTFVVKKGTPKLTAKAKTFKVSTKTKKYTVTLKDHKNKVMKNTKVTLKVNGKTFKATTNSKGQATFKITNLKKRAKYIAAVKYGGSKYYNSITKKIKITVK